MARKRGRPEKSALMFRQTDEQLPNGEWVIISNHNTMIYDFDYLHNGKREIEKTKLP